MRRRPLLTMTALAVVASSLPMVFGAVIDVGAAPEAITDATFEWSVSDEANTGAFNGQCNFMSGGISDGYQGTYRAVDGNATVVKLTAAGTYAPVSDYSTRCLDANGTRVTTGGTARLGQKVVYTGGTGTIDPETGATSIQWTGTFSSNYYGTLTPFWFTDPKLTLGADGNGVITATMGGYASDIDDPDVRELVDPVPGVVIATLTGVNSRNRTGFVTTPVYEGVEVNSTDAPQIRAFPGWGSWPLPFVGFMTDLGLGAYWYTSGGAADARKPPAPVVVGFGSGTAPSTTTTTIATTTTQPGQSTTTTTTAAPTTTTTTTTLPATTTTTMPAVGGSSDLSLTAVVPDSEVEDGEDEDEDPLPENQFSWTIDAANGGVNLGLIPGSNDEIRFTGQLPHVTVIDTRTAAPAWTLSGQVSDFTSGLSGKYLGWVPRVASPGAGAVPGGVVMSGLLAGDGLRVPSLLASAPAGHPLGSATVAADLDLRLPAATPGGTYTATLTITALG